MSIAEFHGRLQKINQGRIQDIVTTFNLACNPDFEIDPEMKLLLDGQHTTAREQAGQVDCLGKVDSLVIGIAGADPAEIAPEQTLPEHETTRKRFFNPEINSLSYFQRMIRLKKLLLAENIPVEKIDFLPVFPPKFYPTAEGFNLEDRTFQYLGVESDHNMRRVNNNEHMPFFYHDFRGKTSPRTEDVKLDISKFGEQIYNLYVKRFNLMEDGTTFGKSTEHSLEIMFEDSLKSGNDSVLAIVCYPLQSDREDAENRWGKPFKDVMKLTPVERYGLLKKYIIDQGVNLEKTHITFFSPDTFKGVTPSRTEAYMPKKFVYFSEELDKPAIINKNEKFGNHPNCIETRITNR